MKINLNDSDLKEFKSLYELKEKNINIADMLMTAFYYSDFINPEEIDSTNEEKSIFNTFSKNFDDPDTKDLSSFVQLKCLNPADYQNDFVLKLGKTTGTYKNYSLKSVTYEPYQLFAYDDISIEKDFKEISKVGYFKENFSYLALFEGNNLWMSLNPNELNTMKPFIDEAKGNVLVLGLGMGYIAYMLSMKKDVKKVTIIEKNKDNIEIFKKLISPIFKILNKITIINDDAINYVNYHYFYDYIFADLWFNCEDGIETYLKLESIENKNKVKIHYWLHESLKQMKRRYLLELIRESLDNVSESNYQSEKTLEDRVFKTLYYQTKEKNIKSINDIKELLK